MPMIANIRQSIRKNFKHATLNFIFIIAFVNLFQTVFGPENSIVGVIFTIMMSASMVRDMTARPVKHLLIQALVLVLMGVSACLVNTLSPWWALPINLATIFLILYAFTYEYATHMYFPYILSYLFLVFISPIGPAQLPKRLVGLLVGAVCIILYQLFTGRHRVVETAHGVLTNLIGQVRSSIDCLLTGQGELADRDAVRASLCHLSRMVYDRRKKVLCVSDASFSIIDAGRGLEHLVLLLHDLSPADAQAHADLLRRVSGQLEGFAAYIRREAEILPELDVPPADRVEREFCDGLSYVRTCLVHMSDPERREHYHETALSLSVRVKAALDVSPVRLVYALRVSLLLALFTLGVQLLGLPHGKWLLFTLASLSLPYADDVGTKTKKRIAATILGGLFSVAAYGLIPSPAGRTALMMLSGYLSFYFSDYTGTYACSTVGALGGAVFLSSFGLGDVGGMFLVRVGYILLGAVLAWLFNCVLFPFRRSKATHLLLAKYAATTELLTQVCQADDPDPQLYYNLVIQAHLQEDKLAANAAAEGWGEDMKELVAKCRAKVRQAHRHNSVTPILSW